VVSANIIEKFNVKLIYPFMRIKGLGKQESGSQGRGQVKGQNMDIQEADPKVIFRGLPHFIINASELASEVFFYRLQCNSYFSVKKMIIEK
jgi:hypothetical protein